MGLNSYDVAVMMALNELGRRHGLMPHEIDANLMIPISTPERPDVPDVIIRFETPPSDAKHEAYWQMMTDLGIADPDGPQLVGGEETIWKTIQAALQRAPSPRGRV